MTKEQLIIKLRETEVAKQLVDDFHSETGGVLSIDTLHQDDCRGCPASSLCGCVIQHPELLKRCQADHKEARKQCGSKVAYTAECHAGAQHILIPLHHDGEVVGYLRCGGIATPQSFKKIAKIEQNNPENDLNTSEAYLLTLKSALSFGQNRCKMDANEIFFWLVEQSVTLNKQLNQIHNNDTPITKPPTTEPLKTHLA